CILEAGQCTFLVNPKGLGDAVLAKALGSRYVFLPAHRFHRDPESLVVQPVRNSRKVVGSLEVVRPATNDCRSTSKTDRDAFLHWTITKGLVQPSLNVGDCLTAYLNLGDRHSRFSNTRKDIESEEVVPVAHVGNPGLFGGQFEPTGLTKEIADLVFQPFRICLITARDIHAPVVCIPGEPDIRFVVVYSPLVGRLSVKTFGVEKPIQFV